jgi:FkbM family methyltransferase
MLKPVLKKLLLNLSPQSYKKRTFRALASFSWNNVKEISLDPELLLLQHLLKDKSKVFFDIGANKGEFTFMAEKLVYKKNIYAFEPNPALFVILKAIFPGIHVHQLAISDQSGKAAFKVPLISNKSDDTLGTLRADHREKNETSAETFTVKTSTLDDFAEEHAFQRIDLLKIDVEGHETSVMKGAEKTINQFRPDLIVEIEERHHRDQNLGILLKPYFDMGYSACYFRFSELQLIEITNPMEVVQNLSQHGTRDYVNNFIFIHNKERFSSFINEVNQKAAKSLI